MTSILVLNWRDKKNPASGGAEVYTHEVFSRIVKRYGKHVTLFTSAFGSSESEEVVDEVNVIRRGNRFSVYKEAKNYFQQNRHKYDLVVDEINTRPFLTTSYVKTCPIIALVHQLAREYWWNETPFPINLFGYYFLENHWLRKYRETPTVTVSNSTANDLRKLGFKNISIVHNGVPLVPSTTIPEKSDTFTIVYLARFRKAKRPKDAIEAFLALSKKFSCKLIMIGDGPLKRELTESYSADNVEFRSNVSEEEKLKVLASSHLHIAPYLREGWANSVMEAACVGTPTLGYQTHGLVDSVKNGETGILVPRYEVSMLTSQMEYVMTHREVLDSMSKACLDWAGHFSWDRSAQEFDVLIEKTIQSSNHKK